MPSKNWNALSAQDFWQVATELQDRTMAHAEELFAKTEAMDAKQLVALLIQYRFFAIYYIPDLAILVARLRDGRLRSFLADILSDELGHGDPRKAHPRLYDDFLISLGAGGVDLDDLALRDNIELLDGVRRHLIDPGRTTAYGVGLRGMGGECVCQIYISRLHAHIIQNPFIRFRYGDIDWKFWDLHVGEHDTEHREMTHQLIHDEIVLHGGGALTDLGQGYLESMYSWRSFWDNIFASVQLPRVERVKVDRVASFQVDVGGGGN